MATPQPLGPAVVGSEAVGQYAPWLAAQWPPSGPYGGGLQPGYGAQGNPYAYGGQGQAMSNLQTQYDVELAQYAQQQKEFADWAKKFQQYQQTYGVQGPPYAADAQGPEQLQAQQAPQQWQQEALSPRTFLGRRPEPQQVSALVQTAKSAGAAEEKALAARQQAVAGEERQLHQATELLRKEADRLHTEEAAEHAAERRLNARAASLVSKERQLKSLEAQLIQEQRKQWRALQRRRAPGGAGAAEKGSAPAPRLPPPSLVQLAGLGRVRGGSGAGAAAFDAAWAASLGGRAASALEAAARAEDMRPRGAGGAAAQGGSDLRLVVAARAPPPMAGATVLPGPIAAEETWRGPASDEDSAPVQQGDRRGEFADNDDVEQVLLQRASWARRVAPNNNAVAAV